MKKKKGSFTLIEVLVVATVIALLAAAGIVSYSQFLRQSRDAKRKADLEQIRGALEMYRSNNNYYPTNLNTLTQPPKYIETIPTDPKAPNQIYYYTALPSGCNNISTLCNDYILAANLETYPNTACQSLTTQCNVVCNYCVGPYGQK